MRKFTFSSSDRDTNSVRNQNQRWNLNPVQLGSAPGSVLTRCVSQPVSLRASYLQLINDGNGPLTAAAALFVFFCPQLSANWTPQPSHTCDVTQDASRNELIKQLLTFLVCLTKINIFFSHTRVITINIFFGEHNKKFTFEIGINIKLIFFAINVLKGKS